MNEVNILHLSDSYFGRELFSDINEDLIEKRSKILNKLIEKLKISKKNIIVDSL